jgi:excisionase family DNA binding protein
VLIAPADPRRPVYYRRGMDSDRSAEFNLKQAAAALDVHYMTAYRYVRTGRLAARKVGTGWVVDRRDLESFETSGPPGRPAGEASGADWRDRLKRTLAVGDETGSWRILEQALASGRTPTECYLDLLVGAINEISGRSELPDAPVAQEYLATATAARLVARLGARFRRPGRNRGTVVFGAPTGEYHTLPISVVADLVRIEGFNCLELGSNVPAAAFAGAATGAHRLIAVGIGVTTATNLDAVGDTVAAVRAVDVGIPLIVGGQAAADPVAMERIGADAWVTDGLAAIEIISEYARARKTIWLEPHERGDDGVRSERTA